MINVTRSGFHSADAASARSAEAETRCCVPADRRGQQRVELVTPTTEDPAHPLVERLSMYEGLFRLLVQVPDLAACVVKLGTAALVCVENIGDGSIIEVGPEGTNGVRLVLSAD